LFLLDLSGSGKKIGSAFKTWINNSLASGLPTAVEAYLATPPAGKPGLLFRSDPNKHLFIKVGALSGSHNQFEGDERGTRFDLRDASIAALSLGWKTDDPTNAHPGVYKVGSLTTSDISRDLARKPSRTATMWHLGILFTMERAEARWFF
jgi:hypothetical protein